MTREYGVREQREWICYCDASFQDSASAEACLAKHVAARPAPHAVGQRIRYHRFLGDCLSGGGEGVILNIRGEQWGIEYLVECDDGTREWIPAYRYNNWRHTGPEYYRLPEVVNISR